MDIYSCKSYTDIARVYGYRYYNGKVKRELLKKCEEDGIDVEAIIKQNTTKEKIFCLNCGKEIHNPNHMPNRKFCSSSCSATYNNKLRVLSDEVKEKISKGLRKFNENKVGSDFGKGTNKRICVCCGSEFEATVSPKGRISKAQTCSKECRKKK